MQQQLRDFASCQSCMSILIAAVKLDDEKVPPGKVVSLLDSTTYYRSGHPVIRNKFTERSNELTCPSSLQRCSAMQSLSLVSVDEPWLKSARFWCAVPPGDSDLGEAEVREGYHRKTRHAGWLHMARLWSAITPVASTTKHFCVNVGNCLNHFLCHEIKVRLDLFSLCALVPVVRPIC